MTLPVPVDRRQLLRLAAAAAGTLWLPRSAWGQPRFTENPFSLGVASGSPTHESVVLWTRLLASEGLGAQPVTVRWEIAHDEQFSRIVRSGQAQAPAELAHSVHVEASGLEPDRWYFYRFMAGGAVSPIGRTRTFPAPDAIAQKLRMAYASCNRWDHGYFSAYGHMAKENLDAVLFLGDYIYEYPNAARAVRVPTGGWVLNLDGYRQRYALHRGEPEVQAMHAACPWIVTWDDHEVQNDYAGRVAGNSGPAVADFPARRAAAYQAFYEHMPVRASVLTQAVAGLSSGAEVRLYSQQRFGRLANIVTLDDRQYRDAQVCTRDGKPGSSNVVAADCPAWKDPARTLLGSAQEQWLDGIFERSGPGWTVLGQQTLFGPRLTKTEAGDRFWNDGWDGYPAARERLIQSMLRHKISNPVLLGGDVHENWVGHVKADYSRPDSATLGVEFCGTSVTSRSAGNQKIPRQLAENPHFVFADSEGKGYGVVEFTPQRVTATLRVVDDVTRPDTRISTLRSFVVEAGRPRIEAA